MGEFEADEDDGISLLVRFEVELERGGVGGNEGKLSELEGESRFCSGGSSTGGDGNDSDKLLELLVTVLPPCCLSISSSRSICVFVLSMSARSCFFSLEAL